MPPAADFRLKDRDDLWKLLFTITERKAAAQIKYELRQKRGGGRQQERLSDGTDSSGQEGLDDQLVSREPVPEFALQLAEEMQRLLDKLQDDTLANIAVMKMEGYTNAEIAAALHLTTRTIIRKLQVIRSIWS